MSSRKHSTLNTQRSTFFYSPSPLLIVLSGPSGAGKDSVVTRMKELGYPFHFVVTATTRPKRHYEVDGRDYHFVSMERFQALIREEELLEWALVYGDYKGIPKADVREALARGEDVLLRIDVQGAATIKKIAPEAVFIFLVASSMEELIGRLKQRHTEAVRGLERRIKTAYEEMNRLPEFDYVVVNRNDRLDDAVDDILAIITAEKCRTRPRRVCL